MPSRHVRPTGQVPLNRALSKLGVASRAEATALIAEGRIRVDGVVVRDPLRPVVPERIRLAVDGRPVGRTPARTVMLHKPRGVVTTTSDPEGRPTVFDLVSGAGVRLVAVGRLDLATSGLLLLTSSSRLAAWLTDPVNAIPRVYLVSVRGRVSDESCRRLTEGIDQLRADAVAVRKRSGRETHLVVTLTEGKNREVRRLFDAVGHEVIRLKRVAFGGLELGNLPPGEWRDVSANQLHIAFPGAPVPEAPSTRGPLAPRA